MTLLQPSVRLVAQQSEGGASVYRRRVERRGDRQRTRIDDLHRQRQTFHAVFHADLTPRATKEPTQVTPALENMPDFSSNRE